MPLKSTESKSRMVTATLDLLRAAGLSGAGVNQIVATSGAPKGSVYHFFPGGKDELVSAALREAERTVGDGFRRIFARPVPSSEKVSALFNATASKLEATGFTRGCPVGAVTLDLDAGSKELQEICRDVFAAWCKTIETGLVEVPASQRHRAALLILATLEGALILARAHADKAPLIETGGLLAETFKNAYESRDSRTEARLPSSRRRHSRGRR